MGDGPVVGQSSGDVVGYAIVDFLSAELVARFLGVLGVDLILSGDNAVVIALAVRRLEGPTRQRAIFVGVFGAVALRLIFAAVVSFLLVVPALRLVGGALLFWIAWKLSQEDNSEHDEADKIESGSDFWSAVRIIIIADAVMSLDNVIALVGVSGGNLWLLLFGLALTIPLVIWGSQILSKLMGRLPWLVFVGAGLLIWVAVEMMIADPLVQNSAWGGPLHAAAIPIQAVATALFMVFTWLWARRSAGQPPAKGG